MGLVYKSSVRENITDLQTYIVDTTPTSTKYFRVSDVPQVLQKGKNLLRITAHPTNLVPGSQVYVDVRDSNGNPIYYEIPDYLENDKSRVISIWIYHDKGDDNTPNGQATITLAGTANVDENGQVLPERHRGKINVKWQAVVTVDRDRKNTSEIVFNTTSVPNVIVSQSVEAYENQGQIGTELSSSVQRGVASYIKSGFSPIVQLTDGSTFNSEMIGAPIILTSFTEPATPETTIANPLSSTFYSASISGLLSSTAAQVTPAFTTSFENRPDVIHTYQNVSEASYKITYVQSGSNVTTENFRNFANLTFSNVDPIAGLVDKVKVLQKSEGLPGEYELLNEIQVPFSSSFEIKVPIPSKNLNDPKVLKLQYLNSVGEISRTETLTTPFIFEGDNVYIGGSQNMISGSIFISNTLGTGIEIGGASSGFIRSVGFEGQTSASLGKGPGGFVIYSGSGNLVFGEDTLNGVGMQFIGDNDDRHLIFTTDNGGLLDVKTDKFFIGTDSAQFISGSDGNIEISSSLFHLDPENNLLVIGADAVINAGLSVNELFTPATINGQPTDETNASSSIKSDGFAKFVSASIGGWGVTTSSIEGANLIMKPEGILQTRDYASNVKGWIISSENNGFAEFENIKIRGTLSTTTFEKESVNAVGGQLYVANSTTLSGSISSSVDVTLASFVTSSTSTPNEFGAGDTIEVNAVTYDVISEASSTQFRIDTNVRFENETATLFYSASNSNTPNISAYELVYSSSNTEHTASLSNRSTTISGQQEFQTQNETVTQPSGAPLSQFTSNSSSIAASAAVFNVGGVNRPVTTGILYYNSVQGAYYYALNSSVTFGTEVSAGAEFELTFLSSSTSPVYEAVNEITRQAGGTGWLPTDYLSDGATITFNDGSGTKTYPVTERVSTNKLKIDTGSYAPNTSGSIVGATLQYSSSADVERTVNAGATTTTNYEFTTVSPSASAFIVDNVSGFAVDEILTLKKVSNTGFATEYVKVDSSSRFDSASDSDLSGVLYVTRSYGYGTTGDTGSLGDLASVSQSYESGQVVVSTGKIGSGYIRINANPNDSSTPYIDIVERTGSGLYDIELKARLGDLSGLSSTPLVLNKANPGFGLATDNVYLQGGISATFGDIGGFGITTTAISSSNDNLILKSSGQITASAANISGDIVTDNILATGGKVGGFTIDKSGTTFRLSTFTESGSAIFLGQNAVFGGDGIQLVVDQNSSNPRFFVGDNTGEQLKFTNGALTISGSGIQLQSDGTLKLGTDTVNPGFEVDANGFCTATNLTEKVVTVTAANSGSYFETYIPSGTGFHTHTRLVLDGSLGGQVTMNLELSVTPPLKIGDIKLPNQSDGTIQRADILIDTDGVQFDDAQIAAGADARSLTV